MPGECEHVWHQYTVRVNGGRDRDRALKQLLAAGVGAGICYPVPAYRQAYIQSVVGDVSLPIAEQAADEVLSLPVHPGLSQRELEQIVEAVNRL